MNFHGPEELRVSKANSFPSFETLTPSSAQPALEGLCNSFMNQNVVNIYTLNKNFTLTIFHSGYHQYQNPTLGPMPFMSSRIPTCVSIRLTPFWKEPVSTTKRGPSLS